MATDGNPAQPIRGVTNSDLLLELADMRRDIKEMSTDQKEIRVQVTRTNGRVTALEASRGIEEALRQQRAKDLADRAAERTKDHDSRYAFWRSLALVAVGAAASAVAALITHLVVG